VARIPSIEEQLADLDPGVLAKGQYLYLYARQSVRTTYWHLMVRNVYRPPTIDHELERLDDREEVVKAIQYAALVFGCDYYIIDSFGLERITEVRPYCTPPHRTDLAHPFQLAVVPEQAGFVAVARNQSLGLIYTIGIRRNDITEAENDARVAASFYEKPQKPTVLPHRRKIRHRTASAAT
jgi:hypothetical protein